LIFLGALVALVLPASAGAVAWGPQFSVSGPPAEELGAYEPDVVIDDAGNATYSWVETLSGYHRVLRARVYAADGSVGPAQDITKDEPGNTSDAVLTIDGAGNARLTWIQEQQSCSPFCYSAYQIKTAGRRGRARGRARDDQGLRPRRGEHQRPAGGRERGG